MPFGMLFQEGLRQYDFGEGHPFRGDRYETFPRFLGDHVPPGELYQVLKAEMATDEDLLLICQKEYIDFTRGYYRAASQGLSYPGNFHRFHSGDNLPRSKPGKIEEAARLVVGQAKMACNLVQGGTFQKVVCIGGGLHHAKPAYGEGFCLYNDVAFCARYLMKQYGWERILILDTDAHAGNGTAEYFYEDPRVLFIDIHQNPRTVYPGTGFAHEIGSGEGTGFTVNVPLPVGAGYDCYELVFQAIVEPLSLEFRPQVIIRNGGSDPHVFDGLTNLGLSLQGFRMIGEQVRKMSEVCRGRVIDLIASGYNEKILPYAWLSLICGLADIDLRIEEPEPIPEQFTGDFAFVDTSRMVKEIEHNLRDYWKCFRG